MAEKPFDINAYIAETKAAREQALKNSQAAKAAADKKKSQTAEANAIKDQAGSKFSYAEVLSKSLKNFEGKLKIFGTKIARGDVLDSVEEREYNRVLDQYQSVSEAYNKALSEGNAILTKMPESFAEDKRIIEEKAGIAKKGADTGKGFTPRDYATELATTGQAIAKMSEPQRLALATKLKAAGYKVPVTGVYNQSLIDAYSMAILENQNRSTNFQQEIGFEAFLDSKTTEAAALGKTGAGGGGTADAPYAIIANPTQAAAYVNAVIKSTLGRDATKAEINNLGAALIDAQRKNPIKTKLNKQGVAERTGGVDPEQFLFAKIQALPEYKQRVTAENDINVQSLAKTAKANGLNLTDNFDQDVVNSWVKRIQNGEDPDVFKNKIRQQEFRAMPQSVRESLDPDLDLNANFATYINSYAKTFGIPATQVDIMKVIPLATDEKGFVPIPGFEKKKRTLTEWQYTPEAKEEVSNIASRVLRDFGFQG